MQDRTEELNTFFKFIVDNQDKFNQGNISVQLTEFFDVDKQETKVGQQLQRFNLINYLDCFIIYRRLYPKYINV